MHSADKMSVRPFVTRRHSIDTAKHIIKLSSPSSSQIQFFCTKWYSNISTEYPLTGASNAGGVTVNISPYLGNDTR